MNKMNYIIASAGTGKTESLISRVEQLILEEKVDISNIVLITFTNKATKEMRDRLRQKLYESWEKGYTVRDQLDKLNMAKISTIHSFCDSIIREYGLRIGISPTYQIKSFNFEINEIIDRIVAENYDEEICSKIPTYLVKDILRNFYKETKDKGIEFSCKQKKNKTFWDTFREYIYCLYDKVNTEAEIEKRNKNILTNNDLLYYAAKLIQVKDIAEQLTEEIKYMFVDECQDINKNQKILFEELMKYASLTIVGDEKQSIYGFRGSDKQAFNQLIEKMKKGDAERTVADINYRSNEELIKVINKIFNSKFKYGKQKLNFENIPLRGNGKMSGNKRVFDVIYNIPITNIIKKMAQNLENPQFTDYNNIVVLCRTNKEVNQVITALKSEGIDAEVYSSKSIYRSKAIIDLYKLLRYLITKSDLDNREIFYTDYYLSSIKFFDESYLKKVLEGLSYEVKHQSINFVLNRLLEVTRIVDYYTNLGKSQYIANLNRIKEIFRELSDQGLSSIQIIDYLNRMIETQQMEQEPEVSNKSKITISTIHTYKGLAADIVILHNADRNLFRNSNSLYEYDEDENSLAFNKNALVLSNYTVKEDEEFDNYQRKKFISYLEEEIRLLYVACTRARNKLIISNSNAESKIKYIIENNPNYVSYFRWILESKVYN